MIVAIEDFYDISLIVHMPESQVEELYDNFIIYWNKIGGVEGFRESFLAKTVMYNWVEQTGYPEVSDMW